MRNHGLLAFVLTTAILVPAAVHHLQAGKEQVQKFVLPASDEISIGNATVRVKLEHPLVDPGEALMLDVDATVASGKTVSVGVLVYGSSGTEGDRVPSPPVAVAKRTITIPITEGTGHVQVPLKLKGAELSRYDSAAAFAHYTVMVMSPAAADRLANLRSSAALVGEGEGIPWYNKSGRAFMGVYGWGGELSTSDEKLFGEGVIAKLSAHTRAVNPTIKLETPDTTAVDAAFTVAVTVRNPSTKQPANGLELSLTTPTGVIDDDEHPQGITALVTPDVRDFDLAPGEVRRFEFRVMTTQTGLLGLHARVKCQEYDCKVPDGLTESGTFDATEVKPAGKPEPAPQIVGVK